MRILISLLLSFILSAQTPEQIEVQLDDAEIQLAKAEKMFNPWYTGPLVTPAAAMMPVGSGNTQSYLFVNGTHAEFNKDRESISLLHNLYSVQLISMLLFGVTETVDCMTTLSGIANWQHRQTGGGFNDATLTVGFRVFHETLYLPHIKFTIAETFPTGKYQNLSLNGLGLNATGGGAYQTQFGLAFGKVIWWTYPHPMKVRFFVGYNIPTTVHVENFNAYGGGLGTRGVVHPGNTFTTDLAVEYSFSQRWVFALDTVYVAQNLTHFHGHSLVPVGGGYNDNLSFAPAIEYNWNENLGVLGGVQFSIYGRNSQNFVKGQFSVTYTW